MTRIQPECFIEIWKGRLGILHEEHPQNIQFLESLISGDESSLEYGTTIAIFLIKTQTTTLEERLINRAIAHQTFKP